MTKRNSCCSCFSCFSGRNTSAPPNASSSSAYDVDTNAASPTVATLHDKLIQTPPLTSYAQLKGIEPSSSLAEEGVSSLALTATTVVRQDDLRPPAAFSDTLYVSADPDTVATHHDEPQTPPSTSRARGKQSIEPSSSSAEEDASSSAVVGKQDKMVPPPLSGVASSSSSPVPPYPSGGASSSSSPPPYFPLGFPQSADASFSSTVQTVPDVDLDVLIEQISQRLELIKEGKTSSQTKSDHWPPASKTFFRLNELLSEGINVVKDVIADDTIKTTVRGVLQGMGTAHLVTSGLLVVAHVMEKFEKISANKTECLRLLKEMVFLAKLLKQFKERPLLEEGMHNAIKEATELIVEGSIMCFCQIDSSKYSKFFKSSVNKEALDNFRQEIYRVYRQINTQMGICIFDASDLKKATLSRRYPDHAVGIEEPLKEVIDLLEWGSEKNAIAIMLHGFGGLGKSTLADAVFSVIEIPGCKYSTVRLFQTIDSTPNIIKLQRLILKDLMGSGETIPDIRKDEDGQRELGRILEKVPSFIYIDNVLKQDELRQLLPRDMNKAKKVRLLLTARNIDVCRALKVKTVVYAMKGLPHTQAVHLLEREIYDETDDKEGQLNSTQLNEIVDSYGGIPKLLELVGGFIHAQNDKHKAYGILMKEREKWDSEIGNIERCLFAYDYLPEISKDPFLDICSFFKGWDWDTVADIVGQIELDMLRSRALVTNTNGSVIVHDVILSIGLQKTKGIRIKFTNAMQIKELLDDRDEKEIQEIKGIWLTENKDRINLSAPKLNLMYSSLRVLALGNFIKVQGKCNKAFEKLVFLQSAIPYLPFDASKSKGLRYLKYEPKDLNFNEIPSDLRHMEFDGSLLSPVFEISSGNLRQLRNLRILKLIHFKALKKLPEELGDLTGLQEITLSGCTCIKELPGSISKLTSLRVLRMDQCSNLSQLPKDVGSLSSLHELNLHDCRNLEALPDGFEKLTALRLLNLSFCERLLDLPHGLGNFTSLVKLNLRKCNQLRRIPESIGEMKSLVKMDMSECSSLKELPNGFCNLSLIRYLPLAKCSNFEHLPDRFGELRNLERLHLTDCTSLKKLPEGFGQLKDLRFLDLSQCNNLEELCNDFHCLDSLCSLKLNGCHSLKRFPEYFHCLALLRRLELGDCPMLEGKEMDNVVKIKTLQILSIRGSQMLLKRWGELTEDNPLWSFGVVTGEDLPEDRKEKIGNLFLSEFERLLCNRGGPFHLSDHIRGDSLLLVMFDFNYDIPWPLFEETIDEIQIKFEIIYMGENFNQLPEKVKGKIVGHGGMDTRGQDVSLKIFSIINVADQTRYEGKNLYFQMGTEMKGADYRPSCWKYLTSRDLEEILLGNCRSYHRLTQLVLTNGESNIELLRELFATGKGQDPPIFQKNYASQQVSNENTEPFACGVEELKGKRVLLEIRPVDMCYDIRLGSLIQLYNTEKESLNLEVISIPIVQSSGTIEQCSENVPWLVLQNPTVITRVVKYFLIKECLPDQGTELWEEEDGIMYKSIITIIEPNGKIFTPSRPVLPLLDRWGPKVYPFTVQKIKELEEAEQFQMENMSNLEFLFHNQENVLDQVKKAKLLQKMIILWGGNGYEKETSMEEFTCFLKYVLTEFNDSIQIIYITGFDVKDLPISMLTDIIYVTYNTFENSNAPHPDMEGIPLLSLSEHDAIKFWTRLHLMREINDNEKQWDIFKKFIRSFEYDIPWMILIDNDEEMRKVGKEMVFLCTRKEEDKAKGLMQAFIKGSKEEKNQAMLELEESLY